MSRRKGRPVGRHYRFVCCLACGEIFLRYIGATHSDREFCDGDCYKLAIMCCPKPPNKDRQLEYAQYRSPRKTLREDLAWLYEETEENAKPALRVGTRSTTPRAKHYG